MGCDEQARECSWKRGLQRPSPGPAARRACAPTNPVAAPGQVYRAELTAEGDLAFVRTSCLDGVPPLEPCPGVAELGGALPARMARFDGMGEETAYSGILVSGAWLCPFACMLPPGLGPGFGDRGVRVLLPGPGPLPCLAP